MKIALCQLDMAWEDKEANKKKISSMVEAFPGIKNTDWLIFPEMTLSGFTMNSEKSALSAADTEFFSSLARRYSVNVSFGGVLDGLNKLITMNRAGEIVSAYSKIHLFSYAGENREYKAGERQESFSLEGLNVVPAVCFDLRFSYLFWNAAEKTDMFVVIADWPAKRAEHWISLLKARAIENQCYVAGVNRVGAEGKVEYCGNSMIFDPMGRVVLDCGSKEGIFAAEATKELVRETRARYPFLKERKAC